MNQDKYSFIKGPEIYYYEFISEGPKGKIKKVVRYRLIEETPHRIYNLGFGDWDEISNDINDTVTTNNHDRQKVLTTVAHTVLDFIQNHPDALVFAQGSTPSRTRLYQMGISLVLEEIKNQYTVIGYVNEQWQSFKKGINYEAFLIKRK